MSLHIDTESAPKSLPWRSSGSGSCTEHVTFEQVICAEVEFGDELDILLYTI